MTPFMQAVTAVMFSGASMERLPESSNAEANTAACEASASMIKAVSADIGNNTAIAAEDKAALCYTKWYFNDKDHCGGMSLSANFVAKFGSCEAEERAFNLKYASPTP